jgi:hypothetical protein
MIRKPRGFSEAYYKHVAQTRPMIGRRNAKATFTYENQADYGGVITNYAKT